MTAAVRVSVTSPASCVFQTGYAVRRQIRPSRRRQLRGPSPRISRHRRRDDAAGDPHPFDLPAAALDRYLPLGGDLRAGQRAFDANDARRQLGAINVRRHAAGERRQTYRLVSAYYRHPHQSMRSVRVPDRATAVGRSAEAGVRHQGERGGRYAICMNCSCPIIAAPAPNALMRWSRP